MTLAFDFREMWHCIDDHPQSHSKRERRTIGSIVVMWHLVSHTILIVIHHSFIKLKFIRNVCSSCGTLAEQVTRNARFYYLFLCTLSICISPYPLIILYSRFILYVRLLEVNLTFFSSGTNIQWNGDQIWVVTNIASNGIQWQLGLFVSSFWERIRTASIVQKIVTSR